MLLLAYGGCANRRARDALEHHATLAQPLRAIGVGADLVVLDKQPGLLRRAWVALGREIRLLIARNHVAGDDKLLHPLQADPEPVAQRSLPRRVRADLVVPDAAAHAAHFHIDHVDAALG